MKAKAILTLMAFACVCIFAGCASTEKDGDSHNDKNIASYSGKSIGEPLGKSNAEVVFYLGTPIDDEQWGLIAGINGKWYEVDAKGMLNGPKQIYVLFVTENGKPYRQCIAAEADVAKFLELQKHHTQYLGANIRRAVADKGLPVAAVGYDITTDKRLMMGGSEAADWFAAQGKMRSAAVAKISFADGSAFLIDSAGTIVFEE